MFLLSLNLSLQCNIDHTEREKEREKQVSSWESVNIGSFVSVSKFKVPQSKLPSRTLKTKALSFHLRRTSVGWI